MPVLSQHAPLARRAHRGNVTKEIVPPIRMPIESCITARRAIVVTRPLLLDPRTKALKEKIPSSDCRSRTMALGSTSATTARKRDENDPGSSWSLICQEGYPSRIGQSFPTLMLYGNHDATAFPSCMAGRNIHSDA